MNAACIPEPLGRPNPQKFGVYELLAKVGQGGMSKVYKARDTRTDAVVAVKIASRFVNDDPFLKRRFELEYELARPLNHPHLVKVLDHGMHEKTSYLVMEYVDGPSLLHRLSSKQSLGEYDALAILLPIADALGYLHEKHIIHRDIKPANILLTAAGESRLADLGLVKNLDSASGLTRSKLGLGTMHFAAPEQFDDARSVDARSDIYSLAATLYLMLTAEFPFGAGSMLNVLDRKMRNQFDPPLSKAPQLRTCVDAAIRRALDADRDKRPASMREFAALLSGETKRRDSKPAVAAPKAKTPGKGSRGPRASRYAVEMKAACRAAVNFAGKCWPASITNISKTGLCLDAERRFEVGSLLQVIFTLKTDATNINKVARVRWAHATESNSWLLGCELVPGIPDDEMDTILADSMHGTKMS